LANFFYNSCQDEKAFIQKAVKNVGICPVFAKPVTVNNSFQATISNAYHKTACVELKNRNGGKNTIITVNLF